jgi:hypothetical protein
MIAFSKLPFMQSTRQHRRGHFRHGDHLDGVSGCLRDRGSAAASDQAVQADGVVLPAHVDSVEVYCGSYSGGPGAAELPGIFWPAVVNHAVGVLGHQPDFGFALLQYGIGGHEQLGNEPITFGRILYQSGQTFFTLGYGDILAHVTAGPGLSVLEAGMGFAFLGVVIGYLPVVYTSFSRREIQISMLDARAGSPPSHGIAGAAGRSF